MKQRPNIIFLHVDQLKMSAIGTYGNSRRSYAKTPNIDRLINASTHFKRSYCAVPVCVPSRTSWYTGLEPEQSGVTTNARWIKQEKQPPELGRWLRDKGGYDSAYIGKWHVALKPQTCGFRFLHDRNPIGEYGDTAVARAAEAFLLKDEGTKPFFLSVGLLNPHDICYWGFRYSPGKFSLASKLKEQLPPFPANYLKQNDNTGWSEEQWQFYTYNYLRLTEMVDEEVGRVYRAYLNSPQRDNTIFIFSSDHGQGNGEHGVTTKNTQYEHSFWVPLAVIDPKASPRCNERDFISGLDMAPTICDYAGVKSMPGNNGKSFKPLVRDEKPMWRDWLAASTPLLKHRVVWKRDYKLIYDRASKTNQLFNLANDPYEMKDLMADSASSSIRQELLALREKYDAERKYCSVALSDLEKFD